MGIEKILNKYGWFFRASGKCQYLGVGLGAPQWPPSKGLVPEVGDSFPAPAKDSFPVTQTEEEK